MNFLELSKTTRQECGLQGEGPASVLERKGMEKRVVDWVAKADNLVQTANTDWDFLWTEFTLDTIVDSDAILRPVDLGMWDTESFAVNRGTADGRPLTYIPYSQWRTRVNLPTSQSPTTITIMPNGDLRLLSPAEGVYPIYATHWASPTLLSENTSTPPYPERFHRIVIARAKMFFFEDQEAWNNYQSAEKEYNELFNELEGYASPGQQSLTQAQPSSLVVRPI